jgi:four helix bundle protein
MGVSRFEDLRVWQAAKAQCGDIAKLVRRPHFVEDRGLRDQLNDASLSVMNNIAEGFLRRRDRETLQHLRYAAASNAEVRSAYHTAHVREYISTEELETLAEASNVIGRMLTRFQQRLRPLE